jgi:hypothetical protein
MIRVMLMSTKMRQNVCERSETRRIGDVMMRVRLSGSEYREKWNRIRGYAKVRNVWQE